MMRTRAYHYSDESGRCIRILAKRQPLLNGIYQNKTWVVQEKENGKWTMPCFPEITVGTLRKLEYMGSVEVEQ